MTSIDAQEARIKRLRMRSWRRGTREMDLILGPYADEALAGLTAAQIDLFEALLEENDHDLYLWVSLFPEDPHRAPEAYQGLVALIVAFTEARIKPGL